MVQARILKAVKVHTVWSDGSESIDEFDVATYNDPLRMAKKIMAGHLEMDFWVTSQISKVYALPGEKVSVKVQHQG